jgi:hypothetical protein
MRLRVRPWVRRRGIEPGRCDEVDQDGHGDVAVDAGCHRFIHQRGQAWQQEIVREQIAEHNCVLAI